jgi:diadenosine tetraphosphate (Ap4A) HIT family hydrolase
MHCLECAGQSKSDAVLTVIGTFCVHGKLEIPPVPGWIVIAPRTHITQYDELPIAAQDELGALIGRVSQALRAATPTEKIYVCVFAEQVEHLHVHVIARPPGYAIKGPAIFSAPPGDKQAFDAVTDRVIQALAGSL